MRKMEERGERRIIDVRSLMDRLKEIKKIL